MKKRFVSAALAAVMALSMTACGSSNSAAETTAADTEACLLYTSDAADD